MILLLLFLAVAVVTSEDILPRSCVEIQAGSGVHEIYPEYGFDEPIDVFCDQSSEGGGWIVIQNRFNGSVHFFRGWSDYEKGFGDWRSEFWVGLKSIHRITYSQRYELLVQLEHTNGNKVFASYDYFVVSGPEEKYRLQSLGTYSGTAPDALTFHLNASFSTMDRNNAECFANCAADYYGAWWFKCCHASDLNGLHVYGNPTIKTSSRMSWKTQVRIKISRMMIRPWMFGSRNVN
ncbi:microfibril-associated glycoprotein 4-like [Uranotaenia lowii]|uniref:microfibril-associated glycoprotein 4-like n=1 Tax=Uranotaenia lowii TaxID=190385 RepID=UPI00247881A5|nr:microfibril-associated glycoprotein 4-like [Uranotaenia lowii]